jgi:hypothetical protein
MTALEPSPVATDGVVAALTRQRKTKRMLRTKAQAEADRLGADIDALTAALVALGVEQTAGGDGA